MGDTGDLNGGHVLLIHGIQSDTATRTHFCCSFFMANTEWNSITTKIVSEFQFCISCCSLNLESRPITPAIVLSKSVVLVCSHNCGMFSCMHDEPASRRSACKQGDRLKVRVLLISRQTFCLPFCLVSTEIPWWIRDAAPVTRETDPPTPALLTGCLSKCIVKEK